ncbi:MAG: metalloregulator ArsR/SmtB family transcription factor [Ignavibacteria bacterium]|nr:metalloregulator ArsR/SmtB family transcription factor [Ignavibacteria bacterium]
MKKLVKLLKALSDFQRLRILFLLYHKELCVCEINKIIGFTPATISQHLSILTDVGILKPKKIKRWVFYKIDWNNFDQDLKQILMTIFRNLKGDPEIIRDIENLNIIGKNKLLNQVIVNDKSMKEKNYESK